MDNRFLIRLWDKENKIMLYPKIEFFDDMIGYRYDHFETEPENLVKMQCSGLRDKNGKLIYEGDLFEVNLSGGMCINGQWTLNITVIGKVIYENGAFWISFKEHKDDKDRLKLLYNFLKNPKNIIGNVYENKELLEKKNDK